MLHPTQNDFVTCRYGRMFFVMAAAVALACCPMVLAEDVRWRSGPTEILRLDPAVVSNTISDLAARPASRHVVVRFDHPVTSAQRKQLEKAGLRLHRYLGAHTFFASLSATALDAPALRAFSPLSGVAEIQRAWKQDPRILAGQVPAFAVVQEDAPDGRIVALYVLFHPDVLLATEAVEAARRHDAVIRAHLESINGLVIELPLANIDALAAEDAVQWMEWPLPRMSEVNDSNREITQANIVHASPYDLDGSGVTVMVYDGGTARASHLDFQGRLSVHDASGLHYHSTHVAGTVGGAGVADPAYKGMAPGVSMLSYGFEVEGGLQPGFLYTDPGDLEADYNQAINNYGADISNNSIGSNVESNGFLCTWQGNYGVTAALIDAIVGGSLGEPFRVIWAAGNERQGDRCDVEGFGDYYSVAPPAGAKNHLSVGAVNSNDDSMTSFSSWGPVDDGRLKPDVCAPGCQSDGDGGVTSCSSGSDTTYLTMCGTSMAAPTVTGLAAMLLEDYRNQFPGYPDFLNSTLKAFFIHNAVDLGNVGPDYQFGYGSVRIQDTVDFMRSGNFLEADVLHGGTYSVRVSVNPGDTLLKVTLVWDDVPGTPNVNPALVNDLDLKVFDPSYTQYYPWTLSPASPASPAVQTQADHVNNIEQVVVDSPTVGIWRAEVYGYNVPDGPQTFSLTASPLMVPCSSQGDIALDTVEYGCNATAEIKVVDCDLNTDDGVVETAIATISSDSEPGGEAALLTETGPETAKFLGTIQLSDTDGAGVLLVADGDTVTATYIDADDGLGGTNVVVTDQAAVDCMAPVVSNVETAYIAARRATVTLDTNEPTDATVRYGFSCGALTETATQGGFMLVHSVKLEGLDPETTYFYAVEARDEAGNVGSDDNGGLCYSFTTPEIPDFFTELFDVDNDLDYLSLTFTPNGSADFYAGCVESITSLPTDPAMGLVLPLDENTYMMLPVQDGKSVSIYGYSYTSFFVGSNGYITLHAGDTAGGESLANHFDLPRISALFDYLDPFVQGSVSWKQLEDRVAVTWDNVPESIEYNSNTFQIEMFFDGVIRISYLGIDAVDGLAGLSGGGGVPENFIETDLSAMGVCGGETCFDGIQNQGEDRIDCGGPCPPCECTSDPACDDGAFCNGTETCNAYGDCQTGSDPCPGQLCDEGLDLCVDCFDNGDCDDTLFCNGAETCVGGSCQAGTDPCPGEGCDEVNDVCTACDDDSTCEPGEDCNNCPGDCFSGSGAACGNSVCETVDGEDCVSCPDDCNGYLGGKPSGRYCCGDGAAQYGVTCGDARCTGDGNTCTSDPAVASCCGDGTCEGAEDVANCAVDCGCTGPGECDDFNECTVDDCVDGVCENTSVADDTPCGGGICCGGNCTTAACSVAGDCDDTEACTTDSCLDAGTCSASCDNVWPSCGLPDGCCGPNCTAATDPDCEVCLPRGEPCTLNSECCSDRCFKGYCK